MPDAVMYKVLGTGKFKGYLIANQRTRSNRRSDRAPHTEYPYFLFTSEGKKVRLVGPDGAYIDSVVGDFDEQ